jgi:hypothetical protein
MRRAYSPGWLAGATLAAITIIAAAPVVGQVSAWLRDAARDRYVLVLGLVVGAGVVCALAVALLSIRDRRRERFGWIAAAVCLAVTYGFISRTGIADADAAERFHFVEYGFLAVLFYKAWRPSGDGAVLVMPLLCGVLVGTLEEWLQWFVPARVGEAKDVLLNLFSVGSGVLFAIGLDPPTRLTLTLQPQSRRGVAVLGAMTVIAFAGFFHSVHLGHEIADPEAGVFRSRYSLEALREVSAARAERWKTAPPLTWSRYSREDQYLTEGVAHVRRRNQRWDEGNLLAARQENLILETYYAPVLDTPTYISATAHRWPPEQREQAEQLPGPGFMIYESDALTYPVVTWPPLVYWLVILTAILLALRRIL